MALAGISCVYRAGCFELVTQVCGAPNDSRNQYIYSYVRDYDCDLKYLEDQTWHQSRIE